jgi:Phospholipase_D-nuclease N-terminal
MIAYDYPLLSLFWTLLIFAGLAIYVYLIIWCLLDNFRRSDHQGLAKALWVLALFLLPFLGALLYIGSRPASGVAPELEEVNLAPARGVPLVMPNESQESSILTDTQ